MLRCVSSTRLVAHYFSCHFSAALLFLVMAGARKSSVLLVFDFNRKNHLIVTICENVYSLYLQLLKKWSYLTTYIHSLEVTLFFLCIVLLDHTEPKSSTKTMNNFQSVSSALERSLLNILRGAITTYLYFILVPPKPVAVEQQDHFYTTLLTHWMPNYFIFDHPRAALAPESCVANQPTIHNVIHIR